MKRKGTLVLCAATLALLMALVGCGKQTDGEKPKTEPTAEPVVIATDEPETANDVYALEAYKIALTKLMEEHILPDGTDVGYDGVGEMSDNRFAVLDIDNDGRQELIIVYTTTATAGQTQLVYGYDAESKRLSTELSEFAGLTFYDNGVIKSIWSHNQGLGDSFWPYTLYAYQADTDSYEVIGSVDSWEKAFAPTNSFGEAYPDELDSSGTGILYFLSSDYDTSDTEPADESEYLEWLNARLGSGSELTISYLPLTAENIAAIA